MAYFRAGFSETVSSLEVGKAAGELENVVELRSMCDFKKQKSRRMKQQQLMVLIPLRAAFANLCSFCVIQNVASFYQFRLCFLLF